MNRPDDSPKNSILIYTTEDGLTKIDTTFDGDTVWLSIDQMADLFQRDRSVIGKHIRNIFKEDELQKESVWAKFAYTAADGKVYDVDYYNLDVIISVGYRVKSKRGTQFRIWATGILAVLSSLLMAFAPGLFLICAAVSGFYLVSALFSSISTLAMLLLKEPVVTEAQAARSSHSLRELPGQFAQLVRDSAAALRGCPLAAKLIAADAFISVPCYLTKMFLQQRLVELGWPTEWLFLPLLLGGAACATLAGADDNFARLWGHLGGWLGQLFGQDALLANLLIFALSLPVGAWLFGLAGGSARRKAPPVAAEQFYGKLAALPRLPQLMGVLVMAVLCGVYTLFFAVQAAEFAATLGAPLPLTAPDAAAFAVNGFWEFCRILVLDLTVLAALHFLGAQPVTQKGLSRVLAVALCGFGAGFAMLAAAKLAVYINLYGPTVRRIWAAWVLGALLLASVLAAVRLFCGIPAARMAFVAAAFSFSLLCCLPLERFCVDAQLARPDCDWQLLQRYTWQSSELDEYITQQAGENANLSE